MDIVPIWKDLYYETSGSSVQYRVRHQGLYEIFRGRAVKSPAESVIRIKLNDCCSSYLNSLLGAETLQGALSLDTLEKQEAYGEFSLDIYDTSEGEWETVLEWAFVNDYSYEERYYQQGPINVPINGHTAADQLLPCSYLVTASAATVCYNSSSLYFVITSGQSVEKSWNGGNWVIMFDTNLASVYYDFNNGAQTGYLNGGTLVAFNLPSNSSYFSKEYATRFYDRPGGTLLGVAVAVVAASTQPSDGTLSISITSYPEEIGSTKGNYNIGWTNSTRGYIEMRVYSSTTIDGPYVEVYPPMGSTVNPGDHWGVVTIHDNIDSYAKYFKIDYVYANYPNVSASVIIKQLGDISYISDYLTMEILSGGTIAWGGYTGSTGVSIEYSIDNGSNWHTLQRNGAPLTVYAGDIVKYRNSSSGFSAVQADFSASTAYFNVYGNIMSLLYGDNFSGQTSLEGQRVGVFQYLFKNTNVVSAKNLCLPATTLAEQCYEDMFLDCTSLTTAPKVLPAKDVLRLAYAGMFRGCTSLTTVPTILGEKMGEGAYGSMFRDCTSLNTAPALPITTLGYGPEYGSGYTFAGNSCYGHMFAGCTSLVTAPELPATALTDHCYQYMFSGCTSLVNAPALPATPLSHAYVGMFAGCTSLTTAPNLPAANANYSYMFAGCTSLTTPPSSVVCGYGGYMFSGCTSLTTAPELPATTVGPRCYEYMFIGCSSLTTAPELPAATLEAQCYRYMFWGCTRLSYVKCLAENDIDTYNNAYWLGNVSSTGTFVKSANATWPSGASGIPNGWTVEDAQ